jgi:hypothetical protein
MAAPERTVGTIPMTQTGNTIMDEQKLAALREFVSTLVENTKNETQGRAGSPAKEKRAASKVVSHLLGRRPKSAEVAFVLNV